MPGHVPKISIRVFCWKIKGGKKILLAASDNAYQESTLQKNGHRNLPRGQGLLQGSIQRGAVITYLLRNKIKGKRCYCCYFCLLF
jgi:hypothetical protein